jgi:hypothetical protein
VFLSESLTVAGLSARLCRSISAVRLYSLDPHRTVDLFDILACFTDNRISSVQWQLDMYGFKMMRSGIYKGAYIHPVFKRGEWKMVKRLTRGTARRTAVIGNADPQLCLASSLITWPN